MRPSTSAVADEREDRFVAINTFELPRAGAGEAMPVQCATIGELRKDDRDAAPDRGIAIELRAFAQE